MELNRPTQPVLPIPSLLDRGMWQAAAQQRLAVQRCASCGVLRYPPTHSCYSCRSIDWSWHTLPGRGVVETYTWIEDPARSQQVEHRHFNVVVVALDTDCVGNADPVRMLSTVVDAWSPAELFVGRRVELHCVALSDGMGLPSFRRMAAGDPLGAGTTPG